MVVESHGILHLELIHGSHVIVIIRVYKCCFELVTFIGLDQVLGLGPCRMGREERRWEPVHSKSVSGNFDGPADEDVECFPRNDI